MRTQSGGFGRVEGCKEFGIRGEMPPAKSPILGPNSQALDQMLLLTSSVILSNLPSVFFICKMTLIAPVSEEFCNLTQVKYPE